MDKDLSAPSPSVTELNACVSTSTTGHRPVAKETTFREWIVDNQIGTSPVRRQPVRWGRSRCLFFFLFFFFFLCCQSAYAVPGWKKGLFHLMIG